MCDTFMFIELSNDTFLLFINNVFNVVKLYYMVQKVNPPGQT
jgi:hypothetical protein